MLSIFYSTKKKTPTHYDTLKKSCIIQDVEIIEFVNDGTHSLAEAYNIALAESKHQILVCVHDDVYLEKGWDMKILAHFQESEYGILGVAGTTNLTVNGKWWESPQHMVGNVWHFNSTKNKWYESKYSEKLYNNIAKVACVDGVFIAINKLKIKEGFDETYEGFHFYDVPFCVNNYHKGVDIGVITNIKIRHKSIGATDEKWEINRINFMENAKDLLPIRINAKPIVEYTVPKINVKKAPKISIIIPTIYSDDKIETCINSLLSTYYNNISIYIADTGCSVENKEKLKDLKKLSEDRGFPTKIIEYDYYHFSKINNDVVNNHINSDSELILFCNDDINMINDAITKMVATYMKNKKRVGTIGCRLHYENGDIQHGGILVFLRKKNNNIGLSHIGLHTSYGAKIITDDKVFGNTAAFMMLRKIIFDKIGGFIENNKECFEDVIFNIDCINRNLKNIYVGDAVCYHYESTTRGLNDNKRENEMSDLRTLLMPKIKKHFKKIDKYVKYI